MLFMAGGESNRSFAHHKYSIASPPRRLHFLSILFVPALPTRGSGPGILQVARNRLPHQRQVILRQMNRQDRGGGLRLSLTAKGFAAGARQDPGGMPVSRERFLAGFACIGGTGFSLSTPACGRIFSQLLSEGFLGIRDRTSETAYSACPTIAGKRE